MKINEIVENGWKPYKNWCTLFGKFMKSIENHQAIDGRRLRIDVNWRKLMKFDENRLTIDENLFSNLRKLMQTLKQLINTV